MRWAGSRSIAISWFEIRHIEPITFRASQMVMAERLTVIGDGLTFLAIRSNFRIAEISGRKH